MDANIRVRKENAFLLWRISNTAMPPVLVIGQLAPGTPVRLVGVQRIGLQQDATHPDLWSVGVDRCGLTDGGVYHYWYEVTDSAPYRNGLRIRITDPMACTVDWQLLADKPNDPHYSDDDAYPAAVIKYSAGKLVTCDIGGEELIVSPNTDLSALAPNNQLVIYELPTAWARIGNSGERESGVGSFSDVTALIDTDEAGSNFTDLGVVQKGRSYLTELGVNALELLPAADSFYEREWGYDTTNFLAPDFELGYPTGYSWSVANRDLQTLIATCHDYGLRFFNDTVMAFAKENAYLAAATNDLFILDPASNPSDPDAHNSRGNDSGDLRNGYGNVLFRYAWFTDSYDPVSGQRQSLSPGRQFMKTALIRWMNDFRIDGIRMDSIENVANWDFVQEYKELAWKSWQDMHPGDKQHFLVVGEELTEPLALLKQQRVNGIWHERFKEYIRNAILGQSADGESSFEWTVRKAIDVRNFGFSDLSQAVIYLTSHDVEGPRNERLYNFLMNNGIVLTEERIKLAFVCLLTAAGIPMILAGEEFADQHDLFDQQGNVDQQGGKQVDPVDYSRLGDPWRNRIKEYVARLCALRTGNPALAVNDVSFIHVDFTEGKRVLAWQRGIPGTADIVVVVANFSDYGTSDTLNAGSEYRVANWPALPPGKSWQEVTQVRQVPLEWAGREPIFPWEAKVYAVQS